MPSRLSVLLNELWDRFFDYENIITRLLNLFSLLFNYLKYLTTFPERNDLPARRQSTPVQDTTEENVRNKNRQPVTDFNTRPCQRKMKKIRKQQSASAHLTSLCVSDSFLQDENRPDVLSRMSSSACIYSSSATFGCSESTICISPKVKRKRKLPFLAAIKPDNYKKEREKFMKSHFCYNPCFVYSTPVNDKMMEKYSAPSQKYIPQAIQIMKKVLAVHGSYEVFEEINGGRLLTRAQILNAVERYLKFDGLIEEIQINLCDDLVSQGSLTRANGRSVLNVRCINLRENWAQGLLRHEIGTHYLRSCNNSYQPWHDPEVRKKLNMDSINPTEEGLATLHSVLYRREPFLWRAALLYYTAYMASRMSFKELFHDLGKFVNSPGVRWEYCLRAKRGQEWTCRPGSFCKDQVYLEGALRLLKRRKHIHFEELVRLGKVSFRDVARPCIVNIAQMENTRIPWFMKDIKVYQQKLDNIASTNDLSDSVLKLVD